MASITVAKEKTGTGWNFIVSVEEDSGRTEHSVTLSRENYEKLAAGSSVSPEDLVKMSFEFLLERESKEFILREFDLTLIGKYFPDYVTEIVKRL